MLLLLLLVQVRLPYLTSSYLGDVLAALPWAKELLDTRQLFSALQYAAASETTRQRLALCDGGVGSTALAATPHYRCPRPASSVTKLSFEWSIELSQIKCMVRDARLWNRVVELHSPLHYWGGEGGGGGGGGSCILGFRVNHILGKGRMEKKFRGAQGKNIELEERWREGGGRGQWRKEVVGGRGQE